MGIQFNSVLMPHRQLLLRVSAESFPGGRVPCPHFEGVEEIELPCERAAAKHRWVTNEISVNVVRVSFILSERAIGKDVSNANLPELYGEDLEVFDK
ncbi:MAG TPA: hypothetical protein VGL53_02550 [Bryobacteraceae bacterium]